MAMSYMSWSADYGLPLIVATVDEDRVAAAAAATAYAAPITTEKPSQIRDGEEAPPTVSAFK